MPDAHTTIRFHLAEDEVEKYVALCRQEDVAGDKFRDSRLVECPLFHAVDLINAFTLTGGIQASDASAENDVEETFSNVEGWINEYDPIIRKIATAADRADALEYLRTLVQEDPRSNTPEPDY